MVGKYQVHRIISNMRRKYVFEERQWKKGIETAQLTLFRMGIFGPALESLKICSINLVIIFIMSAKMATPGFLKIMVFWNKGYDVISYVDDVTNKILPRDSNYIVDVFMWPKFGNCSIHETSYHNLNFIRIWPEQPLFLRGGLGSSSII